MFLLWRSVFNIGLYKAQLHQCPGALWRRPLSNHQTSDERRGVFVVLDSDTRLLKDKASSVLSAFIKNTCSIKRASIKYHGVRVCAQSQRYTTEYHNSARQALYVGVNKCKCENESYSCVH